MHIFEVAKILREHKEIRIALSGDDFSYNRITSKQVTDENFSKFSWTSTSAPINELVWNRERANLSLRLRIEGTINLPADAAKKHGFSDVFPTYIWRNYSVIRAGRLNIKKLPIYAPQSIFEIFKNAGLTRDTTYDDTRAFTLDLTQADMKFEMDPIQPEYACALANLELSLTARRKALNWLQDNVKSQMGSTFTGNQFTPAQYAFLAEHGVGNNGYNPPTTSDDAGYSYNADEFEIKIDKFSTLPAVKDVSAKKAKIAAWDGKGRQPKLTPGEDLLDSEMVPLLKDIEGMNTKETLLFLELKLAQVEKDLSELRDSLNVVKMAVVMGGTWFKGLTKDQTEFVFQGTKYIFALKSVTSKV